jgi:hypothetical protein
MNVRILAGIILGVSISAVAAAQTATSEIAGTVRDSTGGALPGVTITLTRVSLANAKLL